ncbi:MAG: CoA transferase [Chloroflexi bacterium]|nr:CoA transferase [Chloroflexota bacterium]
MANFNEAANMRMSLEGIRILDFSRIWAGPHGTKLLADMGADVIKVESIRAIDPHRAIAGSGNLPDGEPGPDPWNRSGWFNTLHQSKYGVTADITTSKGKAALEELVSISDVVIENYRAGLMARRGFGYDDLRKLRPDIIMVSMPAFGSTGPWKDFIQYGIGQEQLGGISSMNGYLGDDAPMKSGVNFGDPISGAHAAAAVLSALLYRRRTGNGIFIDAGQLESSICLIGEHLLGFQMTGRNPQNRGNRHPVYAPHGVYPCEGVDSWVTIAVTSDLKWASLCEAMSAPELADDPRFASVISRHKHHDELDALVSRWTQDRDANDVMELLQSHGIAATPVLSGEGIFNDPHYQARGLLELVDHPSTGPYFLPGIAWKMSRSPGVVRWPSPRLGEHNAFIYSELLGRSSEEIEAMEAEGIIGSVPEES